MVNQCIVLVGMMGAGKSTVGKALAKHLSWEFTDTDHLIEQQTGVSIPVIFEIEGEAGFRRRESQVLANFAGKQAQVLATGGGIVLLEENRKLLKQIGPVVYLSASPGELYQRTKLDKNRPLLRGPNPRKKIEELLQARLPLYKACADLVVETGRQPVYQIVNKIVQSLHLTNVPGQAEHNALGSS
ncbi:shikimate kinase [Limnobacter sp.]|uniref:shikimate kinase n=1 Tax=Limnobacter sp. TaxID=2003368 RepID=UPI003515E1F2